jgi:hypothetical protein
MANTDYMREAQMLLKEPSTEANVKALAEVVAARDAKIKASPELTAKYGASQADLWRQLLGYEYDAAQYVPTEYGGTASTQPSTTMQQNPNDQWAATQQQMMDEYRSEINRLADAQRQSRIAGLSKARDSALSGLEGEKATIDPYYYDKRNQAAGASDVSAMNFAQYMAGRGIKGSAGAMPEIYRNAALQSQIGALDKQQAAEHADIARRKSEIESAYQSDVAGANADIDAQTMQNMINQMVTLQQQREAQRVADLAAQGMTSTGNLTLQGRNAQNAEYERQAALLAAQYYDDIQAYIDTLDPNDPRIPYLHAARREKINTQAEQKAAAMAAASEAEQQAWNNAFKLFQQTGRITSAEQAQILGLPMNATVADVDIARMNAQTNRINANKAPAEKEKDTTALYNTIYNTAYQMKNDKDNPRTEAEVVSYINGISGLTSQQKADLANALYPEG